VARWLLIYSDFRREGERVERSERVWNEEEDDDDEEEEEWDGGL